MAELSKRLSRNAAGSFLVDSTCIDCDACRQIAPATFGEAGECSFVQLQPRSIEEQRAAYRALVACPIASIGRRGQIRSRGGGPRVFVSTGAAPVLLGFNSRKSFGGTG